ncbi:MAG: hypothetical protein RMM17_04755 [Acidobacteriota bacterium]|nr:hypothetical protein [Blastocatellia bacterium]MDW8411974.1 hypothetical protein [Acidobacteriota bacterium]
MKLKSILFAALLLCFSRASAQEAGTAKTIVKADAIYYGAFVSENPIPSDTQIVASPLEPFRRYYTQGQIVYLNKGQSQGIKVGDLYQTLRSLGVFKHPFKKAKLGYYNEQTGIIRIISVQDTSATAEVYDTYNGVMLGDIVVPFQKLTPPEARPYGKFDPMAISTGKLTGQIVWARDSREQLSTGDVVIVDVGERVGVKLGDYFTIYREQGSDGILNYADFEFGMRRSTGGSLRFRGSEFAIDRPVEGRDVLRRRYDSSTMPRTNVGELVIIRVEGTTATGVVVRTQGGEAFVGDKIELQ